MANTGKKKPYKDLTGQRFGKLTIESLVEAQAGSCTPTTWLCKCDCGNEVRVRGYNLASGNTKSCGCLQRAKAAERFKTHGETKSRLHTIWCHMRHRCENEKDPAFKHYGARGITVCEEWHKYEAFRDWAVNNGYRDDLTIDRIDVNGSYEPSNCRWAALVEQANNKRDNTRVQFRGETKTLAEWARELDVKYPQDVYKKILKLEGRVFCETQ